MNDGRSFSRGNYRGRRFRGRGRGNFLNRRQKVKVSEEKVLDDLANPFRGWDSYFPNERYGLDNEIGKNVELISRYLSKKTNISRVKAEVELRGSFVMDVKDLSSDAEIARVWPSFVADANDSPRVVLSTCGLAMHHLLTREAEKEWRVDAYEDGEAAAQTGPPVPFVFARLVGFEPLLPFKNLKATCFGKLVSIKGTVTRASNVKMQCAKLAFKCCTCFEIQVKELTDGLYNLPTHCSENCKGRMFSRDFSSDLTKTIDWQTIKIQEMLIDNERETGRIPRTIECELTNDLVDSCIPGDVVIVSGIVKTRSEAEVGKKLLNSTYTLYVDAVSVTCCAGGKSAKESTDRVGQHFSMRDYYAVREIQEEANLFRLIVASLCPAIYGHDMVKAGLVLALFGGTPMYADDNNRITIRGDAHVLVVGDPGLGKSQLLQACANVAPRSVYVCGNATTAAGLTATICRGSSDADYTLEAGALALADQGCCCIDEFDKMRSQHDALLEAMEQQSISIAKAAIVCSLKARTTILAAANPVGGHYDAAKSVANNLKLADGLLSRFDLVFILLDKPDEEWDNLLSEHILAMHAGQDTDLGVSRGRAATATAAATAAGGEGQHSLREKLKFRKGEQIDHIPHQLLRKYIAYAKMYVQCKLTPEAGKIVQDFYMELRAGNRFDVDSTPVTTRQLESLVRLAEARAKVELRENVTAEDARDVVEIMKCSFMDTRCEDDGVLCSQPTQSGSRLSGRSKNKAFIAALDKIAERTANSLFTEQQMRAVAQDMKLGNFENLLDTLNNQNYLLKKGPRVYKLLTK
uniref:DNA helicase MCM8 n=1 Tax=Strigamia maritima TaxID=126957 RepID=T1JGS4_STRMM